MKRRLIQDRFREAQAVVSQSIGAHADAGWEKLWQAGDTPWDAGKSSPVLLDLIRQGTVLGRPGNRTLVPGCGSGHDLVALARAGEKQVVGLEISEKAVEIASETVTSSELLTDEQKQNVSVLHEDFFTFTPDQQQPFNAIYDYTFVATIVPPMRKYWAAHMRALLGPGCHLVTHLFPIGTFAGGPPFAISVKEVKSILEGPAGGFKCKLLEEAKNSFPARAGREWLGVWEREV